MTAEPLTSRDLDQWRRDYPTLTYQEQQAFHSRIWAEYPDQNHYSAEQVALAIEQVKPHTVVELGGWDGALAHRMLEQYRHIQHWTNVEICREAAQAGVVPIRHPRYSAPILDDYYWVTEGQWSCDLFVASHVIEHLTAQHIDAMIEATDTPAIYIDSPISKRGGSWDRTLTTHILEAGWHQVDAILAHHGYRLAWRYLHTTAPETGGQATACLYLKDPA